jgi:hypothetical protein
VGFFVLLFFGLLVLDTRYWNAKSRFRRAYRWLSCLLSLAGFILPMLAYTSAWVENNSLNWGIVLIGSSFSLLVAGGKAVNLYGNLPTD